MEILTWWVLPVSGMDTTKIVPFNGLSGMPLYRKVLESQRNFVIGDCSKDGKTVVK
jgi:hypothetical protein